MFGLIRPGNRRKGSDPDPQNVYGFLGSESRSRISHTEQSWITQTSNPPLRDVATFLCFHWIFTVLNRVKTMPGGTSHKFRTLLHARQPVTKALHNSARHSHSNRSVTFSYITCFNLQYTFSKYMQIPAKDESNCYFLDSCNSPVDQDEDSAVCTPNQPCISGWKCDQPTTGEQTNVISQ